MSQTKFPPGKYYVGDLCYVISDAGWDDFCKMTITDGGNVLDGYFKWKSKFLWTHGTAYGDGCFLDQNGDEYSVDAGLIGVLPFELIDKHEYDITDLGNVLEFFTPFTCDYDDGIFIIGHLKIDTDPGSREEEIDYSDEDEE